MDEKFKHLEERIKIDEDNIDAELINLPNDYWHAAKGAATAVSLRDAAKLDIENYESNLSLILRKEAAEKNERITENQLEAMINCDPARIKFIEKHLKAKRDAELWIYLKESFIQKGYAIKELVELIKQNYVSEVSYSSQRKEAIEKFRKKTD